jgi:aspartokinase
MRMPSQPVSLNVEEIKELNHKLAILRHDINNNLSLIMAATELMRHKPSTAERMIVTLSEQPRKITASIAKFSSEFERAMGITRP